MSRGKKMFVYKKLFDLMKEKNITRNDLRNEGIISSATIAKLGKNEKVSIDVIETLCGYLECQPGDIMEYVPEKSVKELKEQVATLQNMLLQLKDTLKAKNNMTDEEVQKIASEAIGAMDKGVLPELIIKALENTEEE